MDVSPNSRFREWTDTDKSEIRTFTVLQIEMGLVSKPAVNQFWEVKNDLLVTPGFGEVMGRNRFQLWNSFLHFNDNNLLQPRGHPDFDPLFKTRPLIDASRSTYPQNYEPRGQLSVDVSLQPFKGRLVYKQYIPSKPKKWGMKFWVLCDSETRFCLNWNQYVGHEGNGGVRESLSERVVKDLVKPYYGSERTIYMDNYYSSVPLHRHLADHDLGACGTVRANRRGLPEDVR